MLHNYEIFRVVVGRGLADFLGVICARSLIEAEEEAAATFGCDPQKEKLEVSLMPPH